MALIGSRSDFEYEFSGGATRCSECKTPIRKGGPCLVAKDKKGRVRKKVCSQECRAEFEDRIWQEIVTEKQSEKAQEVFQNLRKEGMSCERALAAMDPELREAAEILAVEDQ
ncbi:MAG: hypothetical protein GY769_08145 [bacterium]|nr:hypothetical protein [bacterium]